MVVNQDHYINRVFTEPGEYPLTVEEFDTPYVLLGARVLVDATDPADIAQVHVIQDGFVLSAAADEPLVLPDYDDESFTAVRTAVLAEASQGLHGTHGMFGKKEDVDPHTHLIGTAGGLGRTARAGGVLREPGAGTSRGPVHDHRQGRPRRRILVHHRLRRRRVPPQERPGRLQRQQRLRDPERGRVDHGDLRWGQQRREPLPLQEGWNYTVRMYRPRPEILDGSWTFPDLEPAS